MKKLIPLPLLALVLLCFVACHTPTQQTFTYNTLAGTEDATAGAYKAYMHLVLQGAIPTNNVPAVSAYYRDFQAIEAGAVALAAGNTNAIAGPEVAAASVKVLNAVNADKAKAGVK